MTTIAYTSVARDGLTFASQPLLVQENFSELQRLANAVHEAGARISIQLTHAGTSRKQECCECCERFLVMF